MDRIMRGREREWDDEWKNEEIMRNKNETNVFIIERKKKIKRIKNQMDYWCSRWIY